MATNYGLARGTLTQTAFDANANYLLKNWQVLAGAGSGEFTADTESLIQFYHRKQQLLGGGFAGVGTWKVSPWRMLLNTTMATYIETTIFQGEVSTAVTFSHYNVYKNTWYIMNANASFRALVDDNVTTQNNEWMLDYIVEFYNVSEASVS